MNSRNSKKVLYVRSAPYEINFDNYNLQEVGLGKAFCRAGYDFDIVYFSKSCKDQIVEVPEGNLRILWRTGVKLLRTGLYSSVWNKEFLLKYDVVIMSEHNQLMSYIVSKKHSNVYLYTGPYYNMFKIPFIEFFYDKLFCKGINENIKKVFCKTQMAKEYIAKRGITNTVVTGVGLDTEKFDSVEDVETDTKDLISKMYGHRNLLYVGSIIKRKNVELAIKAFVTLKKDKRYDDVQLVLVGKGDVSYTEYCKSLIPTDIQKDVIWCSFIKNAQMKFIYKQADMFLLPSIQEIFGMVLLEAMYFETPTISSHSAGAGTLIKNRENGIIIEEFDTQKWTDAIAALLDKSDYAERLGKNAHKTIQNEFMWDSIADKMLSHIENN